MTLCLHRGAELVPYEQLAAVKMPEATVSHVPVGHHEIVELMRYTLGFYSHQIVEEAHALTPDGQEYFGLMTLKSEYGDYTDTCGLRNSHSKRFPIGIAFGSRTFVCDNLSFIGEHVVRRKHTAKAKRDLPGLLAEIVEPLQLQRRAQFDKIQLYKGTALTDSLADQAMMAMYRAQVIGVTAIADMVREWETPSHDWGGKTAFRLFNCATFVLTGKTLEKPQLTRQLHQVIDGTCELVS
jgi:hypothetical protein